MNMHSTKYIKRAAALGMALLLLVGVIPSRTYAAENAAQNIVGSSKDVKVTLSGELAVQSKNSTTIYASRMASSSTRDVEGEEFTFVLQRDPFDGNEPLPENTKVTITGPGAFSFDEITYTSVGIYKYTIAQEFDPNNTTYDYDDSIFQIKVTVYRENGGYTAAVSSYQDDSDTKSAEIEFINTYEEEVPEEPSTEPTTNPTTKPTTSPTPSEQPTTSEIPIEPSVTPAAPEPSPDEKEPEEPTVSPEPSESPAITEPTQSPETSPAPSSGTGVISPAPTNGASGTTGTTTSSGSSSSSPKTGDETRTELYLTLLGVAVIGLIGCMWYLLLPKKRNHR